MAAALSINQRLPIPNPAAAPPLHQVSTRNSAVSQFVNISFCFRKALAVPALRNTNHTRHPSPLAQHTLAPTPVSSVSHSTQLRFADYTTQERRGTAQGWLRWNVLCDCFGSTCGRPWLDLIGTLGSRGWELTELDVKVCWTARV